MSSLQLTQFSMYLDYTMGARIDALGVDDMAAELLMMHRVVKAAEEIGETVAKLIGSVGANPRKGVVSDRDEVVDELLDVAIAALGAVEHLTGNAGTWSVRLDEKIARIHDRAGLR